MPFLRARVVFPEYMKIELLYKIVSAFLNLKLIIILQIFTTKDTKLIAHKETIPLHAHSTNIQFRYMATKKRFNINSRDFLEKVIAFKKGDKVYRYASSMEPKKSV